MWKEFINFKVMPWSFSDIQISLPRSNTRWKCLWGVTHRQSHLPCKHLLLYWLVMISSATHIYCTRTLPCSWLTITVHRLFHSLSHLDILPTHHPCPLKDQPHSLPTTVHSILHQGIPHINHPCLLKDHQPHTWLTTAVHGLFLTLGPSSLTVLWHGHGLGGMPCGSHVQSGAHFGRDMGCPGSQAQQSPDEDDQSLWDGGGSWGAHGVPRQQLSGGGLHLHVWDLHLECRTCFTVSLAGAMLSKAFHSSSCYCQLQLRMRI